MTRAHYLPLPTEVIVPKGVAPLVLPTLVEVRVRGAWTSNAAALKALAKKTELTLRDQNGKLLWEEEQDDTTSARGLLRVTYPPFTGVLRSQSNAQGGPPNVPALLWGRARGSLERVTSPLGTVTVRDLAPRRPSAWRPFALRVAVDLVPATPEPIELNFGPARVSRLLLCLAPGGGVPPAHPDFYPDLPEEP